MNVFELAMKYYPTLWNEDRIKALYEAGKLTKAEYESIIGNGGDEE